MATRRKKTNMDEQDIFYNNEVVETINEEEKDDISEKVEVVEPQLKQPKPKPPQDIVFLSEEDKKLLKKYTNNISKKLGLNKNRSIVI